MLHVLNWLLDGPEYLKVKQDYVQTGLTKMEGVDEGLIKSEKLPLFSFFGHFSQRRRLQMEADLLRQLASVINDHCYKIRQAP